MKNKALPAGAQPEEILRITLQQDKKGRYYQLTDEGLKSTPETLVLLIISTSHLCLRHGSCRERVHLRNLNLC
jgi:hypothetical protein